MLVLSRRLQDAICIGENVVVTVLDIRGSVVRLGVEAPADVSVDRSEVRKRKQEWTPTVDARPLQASELKPTGL